MLLLVPDLELFTMKERIRGIEIAIQKAKNIKIHKLEIGSDSSTGASFVLQWLRENSLPDAIVGLSNVTTLAALSALAELKLKTLNDALLVGFHDSNWMTARRASITTVAQPVDEVARAAWERLYLRMNGDNSPVQNIILNSDLKLRASTSRL